MKALSIAQPWATLVILGVKRFETRGWHTEYRGRLAIHASSRFPSTLRALCHRPPLRDRLRAAGFDDWTCLPRGVLLGTVELAGCTRCEELPFDLDFDPALGDFGPGRWAWEFRDPVVFPEPIPAVGRLGLFELDLERNAAR
jgi:hypothetical protein